MCAAGDISDPDARRAALVAELMDEMTALRAKANDIAQEIHRQVMEDPTTATAEASLRFQRMVTVITRIGGFQLLLLEKEGTLAREAEEAAQRRAAAAVRLRRRIGAHRKTQGGLIFDEHALQPAGADSDFDAEAARKDLVAWMLDDHRPERFADLSLGDIIIDIMRSTGLEPDPSDADFADWEAAVRTRWAPLEGLVREFDPHPPELPPFATGPPEARWSPYGRAFDGPLA